MSEISTENSKQKRGLGRGLGSLLGGAPEPQNRPEPKVEMTAKPVPVAAKPVVASTQAPVAAKPVASQVQKPAPPPIQTASTTVAPPTAAMQTEGKVWQIGIDKLKSGVFQPRKTFEKESLQELAQSIKENGILQPVIVRKTAGGNFEIVAGERRWRAAQLAGLHEVPVLIRAFNDKEALELAIVENIQREDLNPIEEAEGYSRLASEFGLSQQQIAEKVGKERATVANAIRLLALPRELKEMVIQGELSVGHAKVLLSLPDPKKQVELGKRAISEKLAVRKLEKLVAEVAAGKDNENESTKSTPNTMTQLVSALSDELQKMLSTKVQIDYAEGKGKIKISFYSNEELNNIVDGLKRGCQR